MRLAVTPKVVIEADKVVVVMGVDRLELDLFHAGMLAHDLDGAVRKLSKP